MVNRKNILALLALGAVFLAAYLILGGGGSDEERIREIVCTELPDCFEEGDLGDISDLLTETFELTRRNETMTRTEMCDVLRYFFLRGRRLSISGRIERLEFSESGTEASVLWKGEILAKGKGVRRREAGTGELVFQKKSGEWLLDQAVVY